MVDYSVTPQDELQAEFVRLGNELGIISDKRMAIQAELDRRFKQAKARSRLGALTEGEKAALREELAK